DHLDGGTGDNQVSGGAGTDAADYSSAGSGISFQLRGPEEVPVGLNEVPKYEFRIAKNAGAAGIDHYIFEIADPPTSVPDAPERVIGTPGADSFAGLGNSNGLRSNISIEGAAGNDNITIQANQSLITGQHARVSLLGGDGNDSFSTSEDFQVS